MNEKLILIFLFIGIVLVILISAYNRSHTDFTYFTGEFKYGVGLLPHDDSE